MRNLFKIFIFSLIVVVAFSGVSFAQNEVKVEKWTIPFLNSVTGPIASIGEYMSWSAKYAAREINANGGIRGKDVEIKIYDTGVEPDKGIKQMSKVVDDALVVMGPVPEAVIMAAVPLAARNGLFSMPVSTSYEYAQK